MVVFKKLSNLILNNILSKNVRNIHFIGIGGSGMFPLAQILKSKGFSISGSDVNESYIINMERNMGVKLYMGHNPDNILKSDLIVYSAAIMEDNPELIAAKKSGITTIERAKLLGLLANEKENCIGICGTHGKTTVTALVTHILLKLNKDPSAIIGGCLKEINGNARVGNSEIMVCEACEYVDTFLNIYPKISVILNIDEDHMEYFKNLNNVIKSYNQFCKNTSYMVIVNGDDINVVEAIKDIDKKIVTFGLNESNDYYARNINFNGYKNNSFDIYSNGKKIETVILNIPGKHNVFNVMAAFIVCLKLGCYPREISKSIELFEGVCRRFEILGKYNGAVIADDYAHHPKEIEATLQAAKTLKFKRIYVIFQPFTYSRTFLLLDDFARALSAADEVLLSPIMGSREVNKYNIHSEDLARKLNKCHLFETMEEISDYIKRNVEPDSLVLTMGCGDIYKCAKKILS